MKKILLLLSAAFGWFSFTANAQITISSADYYKIATGMTQKVDTVPTITPGAAGANQTYNFAALNSHLNSTTTFMPPASGLLGSQFPMTNVCMQQDTMYFYLDSATAQLEWWGVAGNLLQNSVNNALVYSNPETKITFPSTYNTAFSDNSAYDSKFPYGAFVQGIWVDSVRNKENNTTTSLIDGWGTVITPNGSFSCLRQNVLVNSIDSSWAKITVGPSTYWIFVSADNANFQSYSYISDCGGPIVDIQLYADSTAVSEVRWNTAVPVSASVTVTPPTCGQNDGIATATPAGGNPPYTYLWNTLPPQTTATATGLPGVTSQTLVVTITDSLGCSYTNTSVVLCVSGVGENQAAAALNIFPNPNSGEFEIILNAPAAEDYVIEVNNLLGQNVYSETLKDISGTYTKKMSMTDLGKGVYTISIRSGENHLLRKVVVY